MKKFFAIWLLIISACTAKAAVDTLNIYSTSMFKTVKCVVITPSNYNNSGAVFPVVYLLHGFSGNYSDWIQKDPELQNLANQHQLLIVCPDGAYSSWYFDSPVELTMRYETNVAKEIPHYINSLYRTVNDRKGRAITGLSMGGHGAMFIGFRNADFFGACGSMSGALNAGSITRGYDVEKRLGDTIVNQQYYNNWSVINVIEQRPKNSLAVIFDCGTDDFLIKQNRNTHEKMLRLNIAHDYTERPGKHDWPYWINSVKYQLMYFADHFKKMGV